ncbi:hypothetical protein [Streptomyces sp. NPDC054961]
MAKRRSILAHPAVLYGAAAIAALLTALGQQAIAEWWGDGWNWVEFGQAILSNAVIAIILSVAARALQKSQDRAEADRTASKKKAAEAEEALRQDNAERGRMLGLVALPLAVSGWSQEPPEPGTTLPDQQALTPELLTSLAQNSSHWRDLADELNTLTASRPPSEATEEERNQAGFKAYLMLSGLGNKLQIYLGEGSRRRRLIYLRWLANDLATAASAGWSWSPAVYRFRNTAVVLFGWVQHTDTTIIERLLVERVTPLFYPPPPQNQWRDTTTAPDLSDAATSADPLYLLVSQINQACTRIKETESFADTLPLVDLMARSLNALRNELRAAADCTDAVLAMAREAQPTALAQGDAPSVQTLGLH